MAAILSRPQSVNSLVILSEYVSQTSHYNVTTWKRSPLYWPFVSVHESLEDFLTKGR